MSDLGYVPRTDVHDATQTLAYTARPARALSDWGPALVVERVWAHDGTPLDWRARPSLAFNFRRSTSIGGFVESAGVGLRPGDAAQVSTLTRFRLNSWGVTAATSPSPSWTASLTATLGEGLNFRPARGSAPYVGRGPHAAARRRAAAVDAVTDRQRVASGPGCRPCGRRPGLRFRPSCGRSGAGSSRANGRSASSRSTQPDALESCAGVRRAPPQPQRGRLAHAAGQPLDRRTYAGFNRNAQALSPDPGAAAGSLAPDAWQVYVKSSRLLRW